MPHSKEILDTVPVEAKECLEKLFEGYQESVMENEELSSSLLDVMKNFSQDVYTVSNVNNNSDLWSFLLPDLIGGEP